MAISEPKTLLQLEPFRTIKRGEMPGPPTFWRDSRSGERKALRFRIGLVLRVGSGPAPLKNGLELSHVQGGHLCQSWEGGKRRTVHLGLCEECVTLARVCVRYESRVGFRNKIQTA